MTWISDLNKDKTPVQIQIDMTVYCSPNYARQLQGDPVKAALDSCFKNNSRHVNKATVKTTVVTAISSYGEIVFDSNTGQVYNADLDEGWKGGEPTVMNVWEWKNTYKTNFPDTIDILDIGYTDEFGVYDPPELEWRKHRDELLKEEE